MQNIGDLLAACGDGFSGPVGEWNFPGKFCGRNEGYFSGYAQVICSYHGSPALAYRE